MAGQPQGTSIRERPTQAGVGQCSVGAGQVAGWVVWVIVGQWDVAVVRRGVVRRLVGGLVEFGVLSYWVDREGGMEGSVGRT